MLTQNSSELTSLERNYLKYLRSLALQSLDQWQGFYLSQADSMNFGLRFQVAFAGYAVYGLAQRTPAYRQPYTEALSALVERMIAAPTWAYWYQGAAMRAEKQPAKGRATQAIEFLHSRLGVGGTIPADPCQQGNVQYSGHLASLLGFYELLTGDTHYDTAGFDLQAGTASFHHTHTSVVGRLHAQMSENHFGGVCCEPGKAYAACNNHACIANRLYDRLHSTTIAEVNAKWAEWVEKHLLTGEFLPLPAPNGLLSVAYMPDLHLPIPVSFNLTDAWGLAFMAAWEPELVKRIYPRLQRRLKAGPDNTLHLGSVGPNQKMEISSTGLNTAFAAVLAREMGDEDTFQRLVNWADLNLGPLETPQGRYYADSLPVPYVTALFALAHALPKNGGGLYKLTNHWRPDFTAPTLKRVSGDIEVVRAEVLADRSLVIGVVGQPGTEFEIELANLPPNPTSSLQGLHSLDQSQQRYRLTGPEGELHIARLK